MSPSPLALHLENEDATRRLAEDLALSLRPGDCLALDGDLGAGKSTLARALIRAMAGDEMLEVPSPTFTLVQSYELRIPIAHFDLYRIGGEDELDELGLDEALAQGAALVEWPNRAGSRLPNDAIRLTLSGSGESRDVTISGPEAFMRRLDRALKGRAFLRSTGHGAEPRRFLQGDASARRYETIGNGRLILMDAPRQPDGPAVRDGLPYSQIAHLAEDVRPFVAVAAWLRDHGFCAPAVPEADLENGFLLVENLGSGSVLDGEGHPVPERYLAAVDCLAALHRLEPPEAIDLPDGSTHHVPPYDRHAMQMEVELLVDWYLPWKTGTPVPAEIRADYIALWQDVFAALDGAPKALVLRDFHSPNLIWRDGETGLARLGIIDFQDALIGPAAYDVASLVQDARVTVTPQLAEILLAAYEAAMMQADPGFDRDAFRRYYAMMAAQRAAKILGIFVRLKERDGKPGYLRHLPRIESYIAASLAHPALQPLRSWFARAGIAGNES